MELAVNVSVKQVTSEISLSDSCMSNCTVICQIATVRLSGSARPSMIIRCTCVSVLQDFHQNPLADHAEKEVRPIMTKALRYINKGEKQSLLKITTMILSSFNALPISIHT